ncbi:F-box domain containing protein [Tanacetum coccineum]
MSTLTSLKISHSVVLPFSLTVVNFKSLKKLWLHRVPLNPLVIKHLIDSCPLLEVLVVEWCNGLKKFYVQGRLQNLKILWFIRKNVDGVESIDIEAPNLCECFLPIWRWIYGISKKNLLRDGNKLVLEFTKSIRGVKN